MHYQKKPHQQGKLLFVLSGEIIDFILNVNKKSNTYKKIISKNIR